MAYVPNEAQRNYNRKFDENTIRRTAKPEVPIECSKERQKAIDAHKAAFFAKGGKIEQLASQFDNQHTQAYLNLGAMES